MNSPLSLFGQDTEYYSVRSGAWTSVTNSMQKLATRSYPVVISGSTRRWYSPALYKVRSLSFSFLSELIFALLIAIMVLLISILTACTTALSVFALPKLTPDSHEVLQRKAGPPSTDEPTGPYSYFWSDNTGSVNYVHPYGAAYYAAQWNGGNFIGGLGWNIGTARTINYAGSFNGTGDSQLAVYGWTRNPLIEYHIVETFGSYNPATGATRMGSVTSDGAVYDIYRSLRVNQPSIDGTATFYQYWSVRQQHRTSGAVTVGNHFNAWRQYGLNLGQNNFQVVATESHGGTGQAQIYVA